MTGMAERGVQRETLAGPESVKRDREVVNTTWDMVTSEVLGESGVQLVTIRA